ncbi:hypothetical protein AB8I92_003279 [Vibrio alginolyticus]|uniref:hypothetical protein n=1 Tax=Vibrio alginolyticus TaxID=663 RepID=UPI0006CA8BBB|nr:hypothetical protein [Vibrio alginolyticus]KPM92223.1 hypothetical protein AOR10_13575 [Vibrio alginolyticus]
MTNMISTLRKRVRENGSASISIDEFNQLQAEWIERVYPTETLALKALIALESESEDAALDILNGYALMDLVYVSNLCNQLNELTKCVDLMATEQSKSS